MNVWLSNIAKGIQGLGWALIPGAGIYMFAEWLITEWIPKRGAEMLDWLVDTVGDSVNIDFASVGLDWARVNQFVPVTEIVSYGARYLAVAGVLLVIRTVRRAIPFGA